MTPIAAFSTALHPAFLDGDPAAHLKETEAGNVGLVRDAYAALARGDAAAFAGLLTDDAKLEIVGPPDLPFAGQWKGRGAVVDAVRHNFSLLEGQEPVVEAVVAQGDAVVVLFEETGQVRATGREYRGRGVQVFTVRDGKLSRVRQFADSAPLVAAFRGAGGGA